MSPATHVVKDVSLDRRCSLHLELLASFVNKAWNMFCSFLVPGLVMFSVSGLVVCSCMRQSFYCSHELQVCLQCLFAAAYPKDFGQ